MSGSPLRQGLDTATRAAEITSALARFGFGEFLGLTGLDKFLREKDADGSVRAQEPLPVRVRLLLEDLGPTFIKAGQVMSTRPDLVPPEWIEELKKLQSDVPPASWEGDDGVHKVLQEELGSRLETEIESIDHAAMAAASMAQVHRATTRDGEQIVLKVLRPGIRERMSSDLNIMRMFARLAASRVAELGFDPVAVVEEFSRQLDQETDLTVEAQSTQRMRNDFEDVEGVTFPKVYTSLSTRSVLALELIEGTLLAKLDSDTLRDEQRDRIVRRGADMVFRQCLVIGFFHADPHPGNIFVLEDERLCFIDCGMTGLIDPATATQLAQIVHGAIEGELDRVIRVAIQMTDAPPGFADDRAFRSEVWRFVDQFHGGTLESIRMGVMLEAFFAILRKNRLRCPADIVYLIKALTTIEGVASALAPDFDLIGYVRPHVERLIRQRYSLEAMKGRLEGALIAYGDLVEELPRELSDLMKSARQNRLALQLEHRGLDRYTAEVERASMNVSWSLVIGSVVVGASVLVLADNLDQDPSYLSAIATVAFVGAIGVGMIRMLRLRVLDWWRGLKRRRQR
jgi:ubiquinone biosynthesis protein